MNFFDNMSAAVSFIKSTKGKALLATVAVLHFTIYFAKPSFFKSQEQKKIIATPPKYLPEIWMSDLVGGRWGTQKFKRFMFYRSLVSKSFSLVHKSAVFARNMSGMESKPYKVFVTRLDMPGNCVELLEKQ